MNVNSVNNKNYSIQQIRILGGIQMDRDFFLTTNRIGFSEWEKDDIKLAEYYGEILMSQDSFVLAVNSVRMILEHD